MKIVWNRVKAALLDAVFPQRCMACNAFYHNDPHDARTVYRIDERIKSREPFRNTDIRQLLSPFICQKCSEDFLSVSSPICHMCGTVFHSGEGEDHLCGACIKLPKAFGIARAVGIYEKTCMILVHAFKYRGKIQLAAPFGRLLLDTFLCHWKERDIDLIMPVPLYKKRLRERGYNQAYLLANEMAGQLNKMALDISSNPDIDVAHQVLIRDRPTDPQTGLKRAQRIANVKSVFSVDNPHKIERKAILLIDDVYTTGATVDACANVLIKNGAKCVDVLTFARAI